MNKPKPMKEPRGTMTAQDMDLDAGPGSITSSHDFRAKPHEVFGAKIALSNNRSGSLLFGFDGSPRAVTGVPCDGTAHSSISRRVAIERRTPAQTPIPPDASATLAGHPRAGRTPVQGRRGLGRRQQAGPSPRTFVRQGCRATPADSSHRQSARRNLAQSMEQRS